MRRLLLAGLALVCMGAPAYASHHREDHLVGKTSSHHDRHYVRHGGAGWCGAYMRHVYGISDPRLNLARNWASVGSNGRTAGRRGRGVGAPRRRHSRRPEQRGGMARGVRQRWSRCPRTLLVPSGRHCISLRWWWWRPSAQCWATALRSLQQRTGASSV